MTATTFLSSKEHSCPACTPNREKIPLREQKSHGSTRLLERGVEKTPPARKPNSDHVKTRILRVPPPVGGTLLPRSPCRLFDQPSHLGRVGKEGHMTRLDLGRLRAHPLRQETLEFRVDGAILCPHDVPARDVLPGRAADRGIKDRSGYRLLGRCHHARLRSRQIRAEVLVKLRSIDIEEAGAIGHERRVERRRRKLLTARRELFPLVGS